MNWQIEGKKKNGKAGKFALIGPADEQDARKYATAAHPTFTIEKVTPVDGSLRATQAAAAAVEEATDKPTKAPAK